MSEGHNGEVFGVSGGEVVSLTSSRAKMPVTVRVDPKTPPGAVYVPSGAGDFPSNAHLSVDEPVPTVTLEKRGG